MVLKVLMLGTYVWLGGCQKRVLQWGGQASGSVTVPQKSPCWVNKVDVSCVWGVGVGLNCVGVL